VRKIEYICVKCGAFVREFILTDVNNIEKICKACRERAIKKLDKEMHVAGLQAENEKLREENSHLVILLEEYKNKLTRFEKIILEEKKDHILTRIAKFATLM